MPLLIIDLHGTPSEMGWQHGRQVQNLRPLLVGVIVDRLAELQRLGADRPEALQPAVAALEESDQPLLGFLQGLAEGLGLRFNDLVRYTLSSYLKDQHVAGRQRPGQTAGDGPPAASAEGCTTWAATAPTTVGGQTLLVKNRDYRLDHLPLQLLARVAPANGYRYLALGSAGSPNVFSSGINERGLAVADTHVLSRDLGPGLPRFSLMRELLEHHASTASALAYLRLVQHMGGGTLILADASGHLAVCESGHQRSGFVETRQGFLASTNHFVTPALADQWIEDEPPALQGNSEARRRRVVEALAAAVGRVDVSWAQALMMAHGTPLEAICRHQLSGEGQHDHSAYRTSTISSVVLLPMGPGSSSGTAPALLLAAGQPCAAHWRQWLL